MGDQDWKENLRNLFKDIRIIEQSKQETLEYFDQFWEFIAVPAFESLKKELKEYGVKAKYRKIKRRTIHLQINFPHSSLDDFHYVIYLPKNSVELKLKLRIIGRQDKNNPPEQKEKQFMKDVLPSEILKLTHEELKNDVIEHYRAFKYEVIARPE